MFLIQILASQLVCEQNLSQLRPHKKSAVGQWTMNMKNRDCLPGVLTVFDPDPDLQKSLVPNQDWRKGQSVLAEVGKRDKDASSALTQCLWFEFWLRCDETNFSELAFPIPIPLSQARSQKLKTKSCKNCKCCQVRSEWSLMSPIFQVHLKVLLE